MRERMSSPDERLGFFFIEFSDSERKTESGNVRAPSPYGRRFTHFWAILMFHLFLSISRLVAVISGHKSHQIVPITRANIRYVRSFSIGSILPGQKFNQSLVAFDVY